MLKLIIYTVQIKSKSEQQIYEFYRCWKYTKYYRTWKQKSKDRPKHNMASLSDVVFHERQIWALQVFIFRRLIWVAHSMDGFIAMAIISGAEPYFFLVDKLVSDIFIAAWNHHVVTFLEWMMEKYEFD